MRTYSDSTGFEVSSVEEFLRRSNANSSRCSLTFLLSLSLSCLYLVIGTCDPNLEMSKLTRAVNSQKCIRAGGKHNDLDDVGKDVYHHTFFEMLGNWSFGDYFKTGAIDMAWKCLTEEFKLDPNRLYATYFCGNEQTPCDDEARELWLKYLPTERVLPFDAKDNFWEMGATGPCGPCTEIHYDRIGGRDASKLVNADLPDVIEIWVRTKSELSEIASTDSNALHSLYHPLTQFLFPSLSAQNVVFIQYNREADGSLRPLPAQHVDTGMGFERLTSILQGVDSNYDTDIFIPLFNAIQAETGARPYAKKVGKDDPEYIDMAYRVVADHIRTLCFAISDGAVPDNDGRGYVLRRVLRRAVRYGRQNLGAELGFFAKLVPALVNVMGGMFPELKERQEHVTAIIRDEEEAFSRTLDKGLQKFNELAEKVGDDKVFSGEDAHFLYTSMGFPVDLTELMAEEKGLTVDKDAFEAKMKHEQELSAAAHMAKMAGGSGKDMRLVAEQTAYLVGENIDATDDSAKYVWNKELVGCAVKAVFIGRNETEDKIGFVDSISPESGTVGIVLDKTSFYAEAGGQIYDTGTLTTSSGAQVRVESVQLYGQFVLHVGEVVSGSVSVGDTVTCSVDYVRRAPIASNHTMTHVLNHALREVLVMKPQRESGKDSSALVDQKGSLVDEFKLRFDFSWNGALMPEQLAEVEKLCSERIEKEIPVEAYVAPLGDAEKISSLRAVFGEKYPDPVRVVSVTDRPITDMLANPQDSTWNEYSVEFCGGTHLTNTKEAEAFVLLSEEGIAKGIRRIVAVTQKDAKKAVQMANDFEDKLKVAQSSKEEALEELVKSISQELDGLDIAAVKKVEFRSTIQGLSKKVVAYKKQKVAGMTDEIVDKAVAAAAETESTKVVFRFDIGLEGKVAKSVTTAFSKKIKDKALLFVTADESADRYMIVACAPKSMKDFDCKAWLTAATEGTNAKGGGKKDSAQMQVAGVSSIESVMEKARNYS
jgi:alanyl-tRNA synthetase